MNAIWSYWSKPEKLLGSRWLHPRYDILASILSFETARQHFPITKLYTDRTGANLLVDKLGLEFTEVSQELEALKYYDCKFWALGKLFTYAIQKEPFIHIDNDVFLWEPLPQRCITSPVFVQNLEPFREWDGGWYQPAAFEACITSRKGGWLPKEWLWYRHKRAEAAQGLCCGIFGGGCLDFISYYANLSFRILDHQDNALSLAWLPDKERHIVLLEQFLLSACIGYYTKADTQRFNQLRLEVLFNAPDVATCRDIKGFTHVIGLAKQNVNICDRLEARVQRDYPLRYKSLKRLLEET